MPCKTIRNALTSLVKNYSQRDYGLARCGDAQHQHSGKFGLSGMSAYRHRRQSGTVVAAAGCRHPRLAGYAAGRRPQRWLFPRAAADTGVSFPELIPF
jgi:hypothetical protein